MEVPGKPKKVLTAQMLENLSKAREKAKIKRAQMGELTQLKKKLAEKTEIDQINEIKKKLESPPPVSEAVAQDEDETEEADVPVKKVKKKAKPVLVIVEESESDSDSEQVVYIKRKSSKIKPHQILTEEELIPEIPKSVVPQSPYKGMHPSLLNRRRY